MAALNINTHYNCETCEAADKYGRECRHGLMFPLLLIVTKANDCPNYKFKYKE